MNKVGFIGTGLMGSPMVINLIKAGFNVSVWNRSVAKSLALGEQGARLANSAEEALQDVDVVITMLTDDKAVNAVLFDSGLYKQIDSTTVLIDMSSITPRAAKQHAVLCNSREINYLDAPVSGGTGGAQAGSLAIMVGGEQSVFDRCMSLFQAMGRPTLVGPNGSGQLAKLCNQLIVGITIGAVSEAIFLAEQGGADPAAMRQALMGGFADSKILSVHGQRMLDRDFEPGAMSSIQLKDMNNIVDQANQLGVELPVSKLILEMYTEHVENGGKNLDHSSLLLHLENLNKV